MTRMLDRRHIQTSFTMRGATGVTIQLTKYCACHTEWLACLIVVTYETSFTMRGATGVTIHLTKYCACHTEWLACLIVVTYETSFTMRGATGVTIQPHQILRLPRKMTRLLYRPHIWNVIYNARSNRCHHPTSPNTAPATKNDTASLIVQIQVKRHFQCGADPTMIRPWSDHPIRACHENANRNPPRKWGYFSRSPEAFSIVKYNVLHPILHSNFHQILRLPRKVTRSTSPNTAPATIRKSRIDSPKYLTKSDTWTSPNTAPTTKSKIQLARNNRCHPTFTKYCACHEKWHASSSPYETSFTVRTSNRCHFQLHQILHLPRKVTLDFTKYLVLTHMKRHLQCAEQQVSPSNLTKYCACHEKWLYC